MAEHREGTDANQPWTDQTYGLYPSASELTSRRFPARVFHYTNQAGFLGIVHAKAIWATDLRYLNDSREYLVGFDRITQQLRKMTAGQPDLEALIRKTLTVERIEYTAGVGVASFSLQEDDLNQWRAYGGGSGGICIGFEQNLLADRILISGGLLGEVRYSDAEQSSIVDNICTDIVGGAQLVLSGGTDPVAFDIRCSLTLQLACALMKHDKFAPEREWRLIVRTDLPPTVTLGVRPGKATIIPYFSVRLDVGLEPKTPDRLDFQPGNGLPLDTVWIGPTPHPELALRGASTALKLAGELADLRVSEVPFRDW